MAVIYYCIGTENDILSTIEIDYLAYKEIVDNYKKREYHDVVSFFRKKQDGLILAKNDANQTIGFIYTRKLGTLGWCGPIAVLPAESKKGVASELLKKAEDLLANEGCKTIGLETTPNLINFYFRRNWLAYSFTYFIEYAVNVKSKCHKVSIHKVDDIRIDDEIYNFIILNNGYDFTIEIEDELMYGDALLFSIIYNDENAGLILCKDMEDYVLIKLLNTNIQTNKLFIIILNELGGYFNRSKILFPINTYLLLDIENNLLFNYKPIGYSIRFVKQNTQIGNERELLSLYHWGT